MYCIRVDTGFLCDQWRGIPLREEFLYYKKLVVLAADQVEDPHRRFLERKKVRIEVQRLLLITGRDSFDHVKYMALNLRSRHRLDVIAFDDGPAVTVIHEFVYFKGQMAHIRSGSGEKISHVICRYAKT